MKIICDCGEVLELEKDKDFENRDGLNRTNCSQNYEKITVCSEHDECWIICDSCGLIFHFFT